YNLGNAYYKTNQLGQAILQYEKALVIQPRFEQASENLSLANSRIVDKIDNTSRKNLSSFWFSLKQEAGVPWFGLMTLSAWLLAAVLFAVFILSRNSALKKAGFFAGSLFLVLSFVLLYLTLSTESDLENNKWAIVTSDKADAFTEPKSGSAITFVIHEGTKVRVTQRNGDWTEIQLANGSTGWVQDGGCTEI
ncbi:MAG: SH3 domain-containing protein, partial [Bacteroidota bacterium]